MKTFGMSNDKNVLTPKFIAAIKLMEHDFMEWLSDPKFQKFWKDFNNSLEQFGYAIKEV